MNGLKNMEPDEAADLLRRLCLADDKVEQCSRKVNTLAEMSKTAKGEYQEALEYRNRLLADIRNPKPFFESHQERLAKSAGSLSIEDLQDWDSIRLDELDLPDGVLEVLERSEITTIGRVRQLTEARRSLREFRGIGDELAAKVADAISAKWAEFTADLDAAAHAAAKTVEEPIGFVDTDESLAARGMVRAFGCNRCNAYRSPTFSPCPACRCAEYRIVAVPSGVPVATAPEQAVEKKTRKKRARAGV